MKKLGYRDLERDMGGHDESISDKHYTDWETRLSGVELPEIE
jgi:hypothetical protein